MYGIECSAIADQAKQIVLDNGYSDQVTIVKGKVGVKGKLHVRAREARLKALLLHLLSLVCPSEPQLR